MQDREITMIQELCQLEDGLRPKEVDFIEDLSRRNHKTYVLSEKQLAWLEAIWNRECLKKGR